MQPIQSQSAPPFASWRDFLVIRCSLTLCTTGDESLVFLRGSSSHQEGDCDLRARANQSLRSHFSVEHAITVGWTVAATALRQMGNVLPSYPFQPAPAVSFANHQSPGRLGLRLRRARISAISLLKSVSASSLCEPKAHHATWICAFTQSAGIFNAKLNALTLSSKSKVRLMSGFTLIFPEPIRANARG